MTEPTEPTEDGEASEQQICPVCAEPGAPDAAWCEACGADYAGKHEALTGPPCVDCGAAHEEIVEGYCSECGRKQPAERDHHNNNLGPIVAVSDRGKRHHQNEDAFAIGISGDRLVAVVCDGVSTTDDPQDASLGAALAARDSLVTGLDSGETDIEALLVAAVAAAQVAAAAVPERQGGEGPASTTIVASVLIPDAADDTLVRTWTGWLGDSRAYWLHEVDGAQSVTQITEDDEFQSSITRWLGADAADTSPNIAVVEHDASGQLLVCSDGLWKYVPAEDQLAELVSNQRAALGSATESLDLAEALVAYANEQGGHDNTTVVIAGVL